MTNQEVNEFMQRFLDDDLNEEELESLMEHIRQTPASAALFERLQRLDNDLESLPKVIPPMSIVDSILPRLELAGLVDHPPLTGTTASDEQNRAIPLARKKTIGARINYRWLGGVVAAGVILTLFITNLGPQMAFYTANEDISANNAKLEKMVVAEGKAKFDQSADGTERKSSEDVTAEPTQSSTFVAPAPPNTESTAPASANSPAAASMEAPWVDQGSMDAGAADRRVADSKPEDDAQMMNNASSNDAAPDMNSSKSIQEFEQSTGEQLMVTMKQPSAIASPDEKLSGMITTVSDRGQQIIILDQNGQKVYESAVYEGTIAELAWSPDSDQLHFEVAKDNEDIMHMTIDLGTFTENVQALD